MKQACKIITTKSIIKILRVSCLPTGRHTIPFKTKNSNNMKKLVSLIILVAIAVTGLNAQDKSHKKGDVFYIVEEMPKYPGGDEALRKDIASLVKYPVAAKENGIQGKVYITFIVNEEGNIQDAKIARGVDPALDTEALRVMNALDKTWKPGKQKGVKVKVCYTVPIAFTLQGNKKTHKNSAQANENQVFMIVEKMPEFPGGDEALKKHIINSLQYPKTASKNGLQGKVYVTFIVEKDGSVGDTKIVRGVHPALDQEAVRLVKSLPKWTPGKQKGKAVRVQYTLPIIFSLL